MSYDVVIAGGSVSALLAAREIAAKGLSVLVVEEDTEIVFFTTNDSTICFDGTGEGTSIMCPDNLESTIEQIKSINTT